MNTKVTILMATYNGEKYISEQIDSIIQQSYKNWELYINDDCSTDCTREILKKYSKKYSNIFFSKNDFNIGVVKNFEKLLSQHSLSPYIMFSDQDDIWEKDKILVTLTEMIKMEKKYGKETPLLTYCKKVAVDNNKKEIARDSSCSNTMKKLLAQNHIYGCTMMINHYLAKKSLPFPLSNNIDNHDYWIALNAQQYGQIKECEDFLINYRQHSNNITGGYKNYSTLSKIRGFKNTNKLLQRSIKQNIFFCNHVTNSDIADRYVTIFKRKGIARLVSAMKFGLKRDNLLATMRYYIAILTYKEEHEG